MTPAIGPFFLFRPSHADRHALERRIPSLPFNFPHVGVTQAGHLLTAETHSELDGWSVDRSRSQLGYGKETYSKAVEALLSWQHFNFDWAFTNAPPIKLDAPVVVIAQSLLLWSMNPLKITAVVNKKDVKRRRQCAFAHTTLAGHQISGEERFLVEWRKEDDSVWYEVLTVSRPDTVIAMVAQPLLRFYQRKFVAQSIQAMKKSSAADS